MMQKKSSKDSAESVFAGLKVAEMDLINYSMRTHKACGYINIIGITQLFGCGASVPERF